MLRVNNSEDGPPVSESQNIVDAESKCEGQETITGPRLDFDGALRSGRSVSIENMLTSVEQSLRDGLFRDLLKLEVDYRKESGGLPTCHDYLDRFPDFEEIILSFLPHTESASTIVGEAATGTASVARTRPDSFPRRFGDYELINELARGGMGIVYRARHVALNRVVALKTILTGRSSSPQMLGRFKREAASVARLKHSNIVAVYDYGQHDDQQFLTMEFVDGGAVSDQLRSGPMPPDRAARLMSQVADAIHYAHEHGVVHRDLKPANILLETDGIPKVTDFGLARILDDIDTQLTASDQILGTPSFMAPEQAASQNTLIGPTTDVYGLGATLYCLLTGQPPFTAPNFLETMKQVREREPTPPSRIVEGIDRELETICLKSLSKEIPHRYATALEMKADLDRYLEGAAVLARPLTSLEKFTRWCRRNPLIAGFTAALFVTLLTGTIISTVFAIQASRRAEEAEINFTRARTAVDDLYTKLSEDHLLKQPGMHAIRRDLLESALEYYRWFIDERSDDPAVAAESAWNHLRVGLIIEEIDSPEAALPFYNTAQARFDAIVSSDSDSEQRTGLGDTLTARARAWFRRGKLESARQDYTQALSVRTLIAGQQPADIETRRRLANAKMNLGLVERQLDAAVRARELFEDAQRIRTAILADTEDERTLRDSAQGFYNLGTTLYESMGLPDEAGNAFEQASGQFTRLLELQPHDDTFRSRLALCHRLLGDLNRQADPETAVGWYESAERELNVVVIRNPHVIEYELHLAGVRLNAASLLWEAFGEADRACELATQCIETYDRFPERLSPRDLFDLSLAHRLLGDASAATEDHKESLQHYDSAAQSLESAAAAEPELYELPLAGVLLDAGTMHVDEGNAQQAETHLSRCISIYKSQQITAAEDPQSLYELSLALRSFAQVCWQLDRPAARIDNLNEAQSCLASLLKANPKDAEVAAELEALQQLLKAAAEPGEDASLQTPRG